MRVYSKNVLKAALEYKSMLENMFNSPPNSARVDSTTTPSSVRIVQLYITCSKYLLSFIRLFLSISS